MKIAITLLGLIATIVCVNAAYVGNLAYLTDATCSSAAALVGGSATLLAVACQKNATGTNYVGVRCNADNTVTSISCTDAVCSAGCVDIAAVKACNAATSGTFLSTKCYNAITDVPVPKSGNFYVVNTFQSATAVCTGVATAPQVSVYFAPSTYGCIPNGFGGSVNASCTSSAVTVRTSTTSSTCAASTTETTATACHTGTQAGTAVSAVCLSALTNGTTTSHATSTSGTGTSGGSGTGTTGTSDAVFLSASALLVFVASVLIAAF